MSINQKIKQIIEKDLALQKDMSRHIINNRALAKYLIKKHNLKTSVDAAISAIRRYAEEKQFKKDESAVLNVFKDASISTRNNLASVTLKRTAIRNFQEIINHTEKNKTVIGTKEIKLIIQEKEIKTIKEIAEKSVIGISKNLGEISIILNEKGINQKGVLARMANEISLRGINLKEFLICPPEFIILVNQEDLLKTHEALMQLTSS